MRTDGAGYRSNRLRALAQRVVVDAEEVRIMGWTSLVQPLMPLLTYGNGRYCLSAAA
jgi:hypothetical protein